MEDIGTPLECIGTLEGGTNTLVEGIGEETIEEAIIVDKMILGA